MQVECYYQTCFLDYTHFVLMCRYSVYWWLLDNKRVMIVFWYWLRWKWNDTSYTCRCLKERMLQLSAVITSKLCKICKNNWYIPKISPIIQQRKKWHYWTNILCQLLWLRPAISSWPKQVEEFTKLENISFKISQLQCF